MAATRTTPRTIVLLLSWLGIYWPVVHGATVSVTWGGVESSYFRDDLVSSDSCEYAGEIVLSHPMSIGYQDNHYVLGSLMLKAGQMTVDKINMWPRCGVTLADSGNYSIVLQTYGDESDQNKTARIGERIVTTADFLLAGYSSSLTALLTPIAQANRKLCVTGGSSQTSVHADKDYVFGLNAPSAAYLDNAFRGTAAKGAKTVAYLMEETASACSGVEEMARNYNMELIDSTIIVENSQIDIFEQAALDMKELNPDVMVTCVRTRMDYWNHAMRRAEWTPKAQVYVYIIGTSEFEDMMGPMDLPYVMGVSSWDSAIPPIPDAATGWTPKDFDQAFEAAAFRRPAYQQVQQSAVVSVLAQAIERVGSFQGQNATDQIRDVLATGFFPTVYGNVSFDENGQNAVPFLLLQYDENSTLHVLLPEDKHFTEFELQYPLPTWARRDCLFGSSCEETGGTCDADDGTCLCPPPLVSNGVRSSASCLEPVDVFAQDNTDYTVAIAVPLVVAVLVVAALLAYWKRQKDRNDFLWKIDKDELIFAKPAEIVGRGSFGLVLLAEYRGTQVAVKRVLPPKDVPKGSEDKRSSVNGKRPLTKVNSFDVSERSEASDSERRCRSSVGSTGMVSGSLPTVLTPGAKPKKSQRKIREEFIKEMRVLSKLRNPSVIGLIGAVINPKVEPMLVMAFTTFLHNETMFVEGDMLLTMLRDIAQGCRFLHAANPEIIHGDLKAANVLVDSKFRAKIADFGFSQKNLGGATGTPFWMSPELITGNSTNTKESDVYAFGIVLYECYSRKDPYYDEEEDVAGILRQIADPVINKRPPVPIGCPPQLASLMCDCLVANPLGRPSFEELDKRLQRVDVAAVEMANNKVSRRASVRNFSAVSLFDIFPQKIAEALRDGRPVQPEHHDMVTIFFSDIVGFTTISQKLEPRKVANLLDRFYLKMDSLSDTHDIFKVETIGDAYMAVTNLVKRQSDHATRIANFAVDAIKAANETLIDEENPEFGHVNIRVGLHSGPVVADVVGSRSPRYCLFGDTVNTASRMESNSHKNRIHCSSISAELLQKERCELPLRKRGAIQVKGKGRMVTFWVNECGGDEDVDVEDHVELSPITEFEEPRVSGSFVFSLGSLSGQLSVATTNE